MGKIKKEKKVKKVKLTKGEIQLTEKYSNFIDKLMSVLDIDTSINTYSLLFDYRSKTGEQKIIDKINKLKEEFAREDKGTQLEAENKRNLMEIIQMITKDEGRIVEMNNNKEIELAKLKHSNCD